MATKMCYATGNFDAAANVWAVASVLAQQLSGGSFTTLTSTPTDSPGAIPSAADTVDGVLIKIVSKAGSTGTLTAVLRRTNSPAASERTVTVDVSALPSKGWAFLKFSSTFVLSTANTYALRLSTSAGASAVVVATAVSGAADYNRSWRKVGSTAAPVAADVIFVTGEFTGDSALTAFTITQNLTGDATNYGEVNVCPGGTLTWLKSANTILRLAGNLSVWSGGTYLQGDTGAGNEIQSANTALLKFVLTMDGQYGARAYGTAVFKMQGAARTSFKQRLDIDASGTQLDVDSAGHGWGVSDLLVITATRRPALVTSTPESEGRKITGFGVTNDIVNLTNSLSHLHYGDAPFKAWVLNLTRNCRITTTDADEPIGSPPPFVAGVDRTTYLFADTTATVDLDWASIQDIGAAATEKHGIEIATTTGSFTMDNCAVWNARVNGLYLNGGSVNNITIQDSIFYNFATVGAPGVFVPATTGTAIVFRRNFFVQRAMNTNIGNVQLADCGIEFKDNVVVGGFIGVQMAEATQTPSALITGNEVVACSSAGLSFTSLQRNLVLDGWKIWHCLTNGILISSAVPDVFHSVDFKNFELYGNTDNLHLNNAVSGVRFFTCKLHGSSLHGSTRGVRFNATNPSYDIEFWDCDFSSNGGTGKVAHATADIDVQGDVYLTRVLLVDCALGAASELGTDQVNWNKNTLIRWARKDRTAGQDGNASRYGTVQHVTDYYKLGAHAEKLTPLKASEKLASSPFRVVVASGQTVTPAVWVRLDTTYNGANPPRLMMRRYDAANEGANKAYFAADQLLDAHSGTKSSAAAPDIAGFELLSGATLAVDSDTVLEFYVDCEGTVGFVHVDELTVA